MDAIVQKISGHSGYGGIGQQRPLHLFDKAVVGHEVVIDEQGDVAVAMELIERTIALPAQAFLAKQDVRWPAHRLKPDHVRRASGHDDHAIRLPRLVGQAIHPLRQQAGPVDGGDGYMDAHGAGSCKLG